MRSKIIHYVCVLLLISFTSEILVQPRLYARPYESSLQQLNQQLNVDNNGDATLSDIDLSHDDPSLDQDPFFLRSQSWRQDKLENALKLTTKEESVDAPLYKRRIDSGFVLQLPGGKVWDVRAPIHPVFFTDEYLFLTLDRISNLFHPNADEEGVYQGFFVVRYSQLLAQSTHGTAVPIYFFPLPGSGWSESVNQEVQFTEIPHRGMIVVHSTDGSSLPINLHDVDQVIKAENANLLLATSEAFGRFFEDLVKKDDGIIRRYYQSLSNILETVENEYPHHRNALLNLTHFLTQSTGVTEIFPARGSTAGFGVLFTGYDLEHPEIRAFSTTAQIKEPLPSSLLKRFKQIVFKTLNIPCAYANDPISLDVQQEETRKAIEKFKARTGYILTIVAFSVVASVILKYTVYRKRFKDKNFFRSVGTILAHTLNFLSGIPSAVAPRAMLFALDKLGVPEKSRVRRFFYKTFGRSLKMNKKNRLNDRMLVYGTGIIGMGDTANVAAQLFVVNDYILGHWLTHIGFLKSRALAAIDPGNQASWTYKILETLRNFVAYLTHGAADISSKIQQQAVLIAEREVRAKMLEEGKDPDDPRYAQERERRMHEQVQARLDQRGLPRQEEFLFDAVTVYDDSVGAVGGFKAPTNANPSEYLGTERPGQLARALRLAIHQADIFHTKTHDNPVLAAEAYSILKRIEGLKLRERNRALVAATKVGKDVDENTIEIPSAFIQSISGRTASDEGARFALKLFRDVFFTLIGLNAKEPPKEIAADRRFDPLIAEGIFARWQYNRAKRKANERLVEKYGMDLETAISQGLESESVLFWKKQFTLELVKQTGLYPDYEEKELLKKVEDNAAKSYSELLKNDPQLSPYLATLNGTDRLRIETTLFTDLFAKEYASQTIDNEAVHALSPAQPGITQRIRQLKIVRQSKVMTRMLRFGDGLFGDRRYSRGLWALTMRNTPLVDDMVTSTAGYLYAFPTILTIGYLYSKYVWRTALPYPMYIFELLLMGPLIAGPWQTTDRVIDKQGLKPGDTVKGAFSYMMVGSWTTFWSSVVYLLYQNDFQRFVDWMTNTGQHFCGLLLGH